MWEGGREPSPRQMSGWTHFITPLFFSLAQMAKVSKRDCDSAAFNSLSTFLPCLVLVKVKVAKDPLAKEYLATCECLPVLQRPALVMPCREVTPAMRVAALGSG